MKVIVFNGEKMNYDNSLDYSILGDEVIVYDDTTKEEFNERATGNILVTKEMPVTKEMIDALENVELIVEAGTGYNNIDIQACRDKGITVCNIPAYSTQRVAHTAIMLMLNLSSMMQMQIRMLERGDRRNFTEHMMVSHVELNNKKLGIIGAGNIGREVIKIARAMDMEILVYTRTPKESTDHITYCDKETLLRESDVISLHCPLTDATRHIIDQDALALMKKTAFLINTSRGALIDEPALIKALENHDIAGAGLDVQETEPPADDRLYQLENLIITPHMGWRGVETRQRLLSLIQTNIQSYLQGKPVNVVS